MIRAMSAQFGMGKETGMAKEWESDHPGAIVLTIIGVLFFAGLTVSATVGLAVAVVARVLGQ